MADAAARQTWMQQYMIPRWCLCRYTEQSWHVAKCIHMMCMCTAINDFSCYITMQSHGLQNVGQEQEDMGQESLTITILANCCYPTPSDQVCPSFKRMPIVRVIDFSLT